MYLPNTRGISECLPAMFQTQATRTNASSPQGNRKLISILIILNLFEILQYLAILENVPGEKHHQTLYIVPTGKSQPPDNHH